MWPQEEELPYRLRATSTLGFDHGVLRVPLYCTVSWLISFTHGVLGWEMDSTWAFGIARHIAADTPPP